MASTNTSNPIRALEWGATALADSVSGSIPAQLEEAYGTETAQTLLALALLRVCRPDLPTTRIPDAFCSSWVSVLCPCAGLDQGSVWEYLHRIGEEYPSFRRFLSLRQQELLQGQPVFLDSILKSPRSRTGDWLEDYTRAPAPSLSVRPRLMYAFTLDTLEPVLAGCLAQSEGELICYKDFLQFFRLPEVTVLTDEKEFRRNHFFSVELESPYARYAPLADYSQRMESAVLHTLKFVAPDSVPEEHQELIRAEKPLFPSSSLRCRESRLKTGGWLYRFRDEEQIRQEERQWLLMHPYGAGEDLNRLRSRVATVWVESDQAMDPGIIYRAVCHRRTVRLLMQSFHSAADPDLKEADEPTLIGTEIADFLAAILAARMISRMDEAGLLKTMTFGEVLASLRSIPRIHSTPKGKWKVPSLSPGVAHLARSLKLKL